MESNQLGGREERERERDEKAGKEESEEEKWVEAEMVYSNSKRGIPVRQVRQARQAAQVRQVDEKTPGWFMSFHQKKR